MDSRPKIVLAHATIPNHTRQPVQVFIIFIKGFPWNITTSQELTVLQGTDIPVQELHPFVHVHAH